MCWLLTAPRGARRTRCEQHRGDPVSLTVSVAGRSWARTWVARRGSERPSSPATMGRTGSFLVPQRSTDPLRWGHQRAAAWGESKQQGGALPRVPSTPICRGSSIPLQPRGIRVRFVHLSALPSPSLVPGNVSVPKCFNVSFCSSPGGLGAARSRLQDRAPRAPCSAGCGPCPVLHLWRRAALTRVSQHLPVFCKMLFALAEHPPAAPGSTDIPGRQPSRPPGLGDPGPFIIFFLFFFLFVFFSFFFNHVDGSCAQRKKGKG